MTASNWVYIHGEDDRLSSAVVEILRGGTLSITQLQKWLKSFLAPNDGSWKGAWTNEESTRAYFNVRNFLRSLYIKATAAEDIPRQEELEKMILNAIQELKPF